MNNIEGLTIRFLNLNHNYDKTYPINKIMEFYDKPEYMIYLWGKRGNGKTIAVQYYLAKMGQRPKNEGYYTYGKYITMSNLLMELYAGDFSEKVKIVKKYSEKYFMLVIDEIDKITLTDYKEEMIFNILDNRISNMMYTIISANKSIGELKDQLGINIISRILDNAVVIENKGEVLR